MREEVGFTPTKIKESKKTYNRAKNKCKKNDIECE